MTVRRTVVLALAVLLAPAWGTAAEARAKPRPCPGSAVLKSDVARLYVTTDSHDETLYRVVSCFRRTRERRVLASWISEGSIADQPAPQYWLTGRYAAINQAYCSADPFDSEPCVGTMKVIDLRTGRRVATVATGDFLHDFVLTFRGSVGMIHRRQLILVRRGVAGVLDTAAEVASMAYAWESGRLYWTSGGQPRSASLR